MGDSVSISFDVDMEAVIDVSFKFRLEETINGHIFQ
jgi:hypothetical protein